MELEDGVDYYEGTNYYDVDDYFGCFIMMMFIMMFAVVYYDYGDGDFYDVYYYVCCGLL